MSAARRAALAKLGTIRETIIAGGPVQCWVSDWWKGLLPDDRRTLLAFCGQDDTDENARRPWLQYTAAARAAIVAECKRLHRLTNTLLWA